MKKLFLSVLVIMLTVTLSGCGFNLAKNQNASANQTKEPIKIGAQFSLTGFGASWGNNNLRGAQLAIDEINQNGGIAGRQLQFIAEDNQTDQKESVNATNKLIDTDKIDFLLTGWSDHTFPIIPVIEQKKVITITVSAGAPDITKSSRYLFRTWPSDVLPIKKLIAACKGNKLTKFVVINTLGSWESALGDAFEQEVNKDPGLEIAGHSRLSAATSDFRTEIIKIKKLKPDAVYIGLQSNAIGFFLKQARELGLDAQLIYPVDINFPEMVGDEQTRALAEGIMFPLYQKSGDSFIRSFKNKFGSEPGISADTAYDAIYVIAEAIKKVDSVDPDKISDALKEISYNGASGHIKFNQYGDRKSADISIMQYRNEKFVPYQE